jgi:hypothetical protein
MTNSEPTESSPEARVPQGRELRPALPAIRRQFYCLTGRGGSELHILVEDTEEMPGHPEVRSLWLTPEDLPELEKAIAHLKGASGRQEGLRIDLPGGNP